jgi:hypothetical protein
MNATGSVAHHHRLHSLFAAMIFISFTAINFSERFNREKPSPLLTRFYGFVLLIRFNGRPA